VTVPADTSADGTSGPAERAIADAPNGSSSGLPAESLRWVEATLRGEVLRAERFIRGRQTWWLDVRTASGTRQWMLKGRRAPAKVAARSRILTEYGVAREAEAMRALAGTGILVPAVGGCEPDLALLLVERMPGSALLQRASPAERQQVIAEYGRQLARLHRLDWRSLPVGRAIPVPASVEEMTVGGWLRAAEADYAASAARRRHPEPLLDLVAWWLHHHQPAGRSLDEMRLLHGDAGVNNFLFEHGQLTAFVDWELTIVADPVSDLGNARFREALYPTGTYPALVAAYEAAAGSPVDGSALSYYTALGAIVLSLAMAANVHRPRASQPEVVARIWQDAVARCVACEAIAEAAGVDLGYDERPGDDWSVFDAHTELMADRLAQQMTAAGPGWAAAESVAYAQLARAVQNMVRSTTIVTSRFLDDAAAVLRRPDSVPAALAAMSALLADDPARHVVDLLTVLGRDARRRLEVLRPLQAAEVWEDSAPAIRAEALPPGTRVMPGLSADVPA
jgi:aminoglycoside phosphotransferase (APT) family kinase protein